MTVRSWEDEMREGVGEGGGSKYCNLTTKYSK